MVRAERRGGSPRGRGGAAGGARARLLGSARYEEFRGTRVFTALDGLRAVSVVAVIWQHTSGTPGPPLLARGGYGVEFFFAISGFLITTLLLREHDRAGRISLRGFYARRTLRIMPLYYAVLLVYVGLTLGFRLGSEQGREFLAHLPAFATYTSNWFVDLGGGERVTFYFAWSLATEEQFYLLWPPLLVLALSMANRLRRGRLWPPLVLLGVLVAANQTALAAGGGGLAATVVASLSLPILLGSAAAVLLHHPRAFAAAAPVLSAPWCAPALAVATVAALAAGAPKQLAQVCLVLLVASLCVTERTPLHPLLRWRPLARVGVVSYGVYLTHMLCANAVRAVLPEAHSVRLFLATTLLTVAVASASYRWFETPLIALGRRCSDRLQGPVRARPPAARSRRLPVAPVAGAARGRPRGMLR